MLSFGIRFGLGFDRSSLLKVLQTTPVGTDYDLLVIGASPGGVACALEASQAGKKTIIVKWKRLSPAEEEGVDEDLEEMAEVLEVHGEGDEMHNSSDTGIGSIHSKKKTKSNSKETLSQNSAKRSRKVRHSRLDMNNELFRRDQHGRKLMHNASVIRDLIEDAKNCGWRLVPVTQPLTINWSKMMEQVMDYMMKESWELMNGLHQNHIEVIEGSPVFVSNHSVTVKCQDGVERVITAEFICIAPSGEYIIPEDVEGAEDYGITCDDFIRMNEPPGKTLVVGALPEGLECAGIVACCNFPATVVSRSQILKGHDSELTQIIVNHLKRRGTVFYENTAVKSVEITKDEKLLVTFVPAENKEAEKTLEASAPGSGVFDTVLFAVGRKTFVKPLNLEEAGVLYEQENQKIKTDEQETTSVSNIYAVGDVSENRPEGYEVQELAGKLLGRRLFQNGSLVMDYTMVPSVIFTPTEYAFVGISEDAALSRFGEECIDIYRGSFTPLDFVIPPRKGECFGKILVFKSTDLVIGLHVFGPDAGEIIQGFAAAIKIGLTMSKLQTVVGVPATRAQTILKFTESRNQDTEAEF